ncbi:methyltransferase [Chromobacterium haemolyticum]|nr:methyltransferase [Chromobacterium haemolyticum]
MLSDGCAMTQNHPKLPVDPYYEGVPEYMTQVYDWAYVNPRKAGWLDRNLVVRVLLFFNDQRLMRAYLEQIRPGDKVWQVAHVYGDLVQRAADRAGQDGRFVLTDITPVQIEHAERKLRDRPQAAVVRANAGNYRLESDDFNLICSFFLLHEVPDHLKRAIVDNMLSQVPPGGRAVFVDYHRPKPWQPIGWLLKWVNRALEPFAEALWNHEIRDYAQEADGFDWSKRTLFGGVYQVTTAKRKP